MSRGQAGQRWWRLRIRAVGVCLLLCTFLCPALAQEFGVLRGQITDPSGAAIPAAMILLHAPGGTSLSAETGSNGTYFFPTLPAGTYTIRVSAAGFSAFTNPKVSVKSGTILALDVMLSIAGAQEEVTVADAAEVDLDPNRNRSATVLQDQALDAMSDDPDDLRNDLMSLAGPVGGPDDGFSNGQLPPKSSIREVRVNANPFSSEFDKIGYGKK
jgi:Carboxypeptidase regulatory-like domain